MKERDIVYKSISFSDLRESGLELDIQSNGDSYRIVGGKYKGKRVDTEDIYKALNLLGIRDNHFVEVMSVSEHINSKGIRVKDYRVVGQERSDKKWIASGFASDEAKMASCKMKDMVGYASQLSNGGDRK